MIIMTSRNNLELSKRCFETLLAQLGEPKIVVVDNASDDGTGRWVKTLVSGPMPDQGPRVFGCVFNQPRSVAQMWNMALDFAWANMEQRALVVNNDTELLPQTYRILGNELALSGPSVGIVTCVSVRDRLDLVMPDKFPEPNKHPDYSCFMISRAAHKRVRFDEGCEGAFYEDNIHHVEMHRAGIEAINAGIPFLHHGSMTIKTATPEERERIEENALRNRQRFFRKFGCYPGTKAYERLFD